LFRVRSGGTAGCCLSLEGAQLLGRPVPAIMTEGVRTCTSNDSVEDLMRVMTQERIRHVPVVDQGTLVGIVSIGDVVKSRIDELEGERDDLIKYISQRVWSPIARNAITTRPIHGGPAAR
jgi:predicted transcriptional regulator